MDNLTINDIRPELEKKFADRPELLSTLLEQLRPLECEFERDVYNNVWPEDENEGAFYGRFLLAHRRYSFGKDNHELTAEAKREIAMRCAISSPVYMYDHGGQVCSYENPANTIDPGGWDSGLLGWWVMTPERLTELGLKLDDEPEQRRKQAKDWAEADMQTLNAWLAGDIWSLRLVWTDGCPPPAGMTVADVTEGGCYSGPLYGDKDARSCAKDRLLDAVLVCSRVMEKQQQENKQHA